MRCLPHKDLHQQLSRADCELTNGQDLDSTSPVPMAIGRHYRCTKLARLLLSRGMKSARPKAHHVQVEVTPNPQPITQGRLCIPVADSCGFRQASCTPTQPWNGTISRGYKQNVTKSQGRTTLYFAQRSRSQRPEPSWTALLNGRAPSARNAVEFSVLSIR